MAEVLDAAVLDELKSTVGPDFVAELIGTFLDEAPSILVDMKKASETGDTDAIRRAAHSLKSNASTFGALALADEARCIEMHGLGARAAETLEALQASCDQACAALQAHLDD